MKIANGKDFWAGLMFLGFGLFFTIVSMENYSMGSAVRMGPAYFPTMLGALCAILGAVVFLRGFFSKIQHPLKVFPFKVWMIVPSAIIGAIVYFGETWFKELGRSGRITWSVLQTLAVLLFLAAWGDRALFLILVATFAFGYALKPLGLVVATAILIYGSALAGHEFNTKEVTIMFVALAIFSVFAFIYGLQLPFSTWPNWD